MRVTGRGRGFESKSKNLKTPDARFTGTRRTKASWRGAVSKFPNVPNRSLLVPALILGPDGSYGDGEPLPEDEYQIRR